MRQRPRRIIALALGLLGLFGCAGEQPDNLGVQDGLLAPCPHSPNCVSSQATDERHRIAPLTFADEPDTAWARLRLVLNGRADATLIEEQPGYLRFELRTTLFVDDAEFLLDPVNRVIHVRSASRLGYSDLGKNRSRMEEIRAQFALPEGR
jgi:uncharacterized protein (DUF1499 family)